MINKEGQTDPVSKQPHWQWYCQCRNPNCSALFEMFLFIDFHQLILFHFIYWVIFYDSIELNTYVANCLDIEDLVWIL